MLIAINSNNDKVITNPIDGDYFFSEEELIELLYDRLGEHLVLDVDTGKAYDIVVQLEER